MTSNHGNINLSSQQWTNTLNTISVNTILGNAMRSLWISLIFLALICTLAFTSTASAQQPIASGFALQTNISTAAQTFDDDLVGLYSLEGNFALGYKTGGLILSVGLNFNVFTETSTYDGSIESPTETFKRTYYTFVVGPDIQFTIVRSADQRAEIFGLTSLGIGTWDAFSETIPDNNPSTEPEVDETRLNIRWRIAPGVRYWLHPNIAAGLAAGVLGDHRIFNRENDDNSLTVIAPFAQFGLLGAF